MVYQYQTCDGEKFLRELPARQHVVDLKDISHSEAEQYVEEITETKEEEDDGDEELLEVYNFRFEEFWEAVREVTVKATTEDEARERAEDLILEEATRLTHKVHQDMDKLGKVDEVPRSKIESGEYYREEDDSE